MEVTPAESANEATEQDIHCPLCDYNLRGLSEARCPECGGQFNWEELRDPTKRRHPYLFEHHPERNLWSFWNTAIGGLVPRAFWATLHPTQPSNPRRLVLYWMLFAFIASLCVMVDYANDCLLLNLQTPAMRTQMQAQFNGRSFDPLYRDSIISTYGSVQKYIDAVEPLPPSIGFFRNAAGFRTHLYFFGGWGRSVSFPHNIPFLMLAWLWPLTAALTLMMLRATMRHAQVRASHLFRVTIYSADVMLWLGLFELVISSIQLARGWGATSPMMPGMPLPGGLEVLSFLGGLGSWIAVLIMMYRLTIAIRKYLRFRHAAATAFAVQIIFVLVVLKLMFVFAGY
jgi:hypothetical protein